MNYRTFKDLRCWQEAHKLTLVIYDETKNFPREERFGLISQMQRASVSVCANMAEGFKKGRKDFIRFLDISQASLEELKYHLLLAKDLKYLEIKKYDALMVMADDVGRMLYGLIKKLKTL